MVKSDIEPKEIWIHALGAKAGGGVTYLESVLPELFSQLEGTGVRLVLLVPKMPQNLQIPAWCEVHVMRLAAANWVTRLLFDQLVLPLRLFLHRRAVLFCSGSFPPILKPVQTSVLVRNAIYFERDFLRRELPRRRLMLRLQALLIRLGAQGCAAIHYPSRYMRQLVERDAPQLEGAGVVNYYGIREVMLQARDQRPVRGVNAARPVFLYVMNYTLQKNLQYVLEALVLAKDRNVNVQLMVTSRLTQGPPSSFETDRALIDEHGLLESGYLVPVGPKFGSDLVALYHQVDACVFPSICESFGHPLVEALAVGKPIICADREYAHEICGDLALYVDPKRPEDLVRLWERWPEIASRHLPTDLRSLTSRFSWTRHVAMLLDTLRAGGTA